MGILDLEQENLKFTMQYNKLYQELARGSKSELGQSIGNPMYVNDVTLSKLPDTISNMYTFMKTTTVSHYKTVSSKFDVTNKLLGELIDLEYKLWGESKSFDPTKFISDSNSQLEESINKSVDEFQTGYKKFLETKLQAIQEVIQDENKKRSQEEESRNKENRRKSDSHHKELLSGLKNVVGSGLKAMLGSLSDNLLRYGTNYYDNEFTNKISSTVTTIESTLGNGVSKLGSMTSGLTSGLKNIANSITGGLGNLADMYTDPEIVKAFGKYGSSGIQRAQKLYEDRTEIMKELVSDYGYSESEAKRIATAEMTRTGMRDYSRLTFEQKLLDERERLDYQRQLRRDEEDYQRSIRLRRAAEQRQWGQSAQLSATEVFRNPQQIRTAQKQIYQMDRIMPDLNFQATEFYQTMISVFDETGKMSRDVFSDIRKLSKNLMVSPQTLTQIGDTYVKYIKLMTKGGTEFQRQMTNVVKVTAKLEDQFLSSSSIFGEVQEIGFTAISEMSDDLLVRSQLFAHELGMSITEFQNIMQTDPSRGAEMLVSAKKGWATRMGIDLTNGLDQREMALLQQIGISGYEAIASFVEEATADLSAAEKALTEDKGVEYGPLQRQIDLQNEVYDHQLDLIEKQYDRQRSLEDRAYTRRMDAWETETSIRHKWFDAYYTNWEKRQKQMDDELLNNAALDTWNDRLLTASMGLQGVGDVANQTAVAMQGAAVGIIDFAGSFLGSLFGSGGIGKLFGGSGAGGKIAQGLGNVSSAMISGGEALSGGALSGTAAGALGATTTAVGVSSMVYGAGRGVESINTLTSGSSSTKDREHATQVGIGALGMIGGGTAATLAGIGAVSGPVGWVGLAVAAVAYAGIKYADTIDKMTNVSNSVNKILEETETNFTQKMQIENKQAKSTEDVMKNFKLNASNTAKELYQTTFSIDKVSQGFYEFGGYLKDDVKKELQNLNSQLQNGQIDLSTFDSKIKDLSSREGNDALSIMYDQLQQQVTPTLQSFSSFIQQDSLDKLRSLSQQLQTGTIDQEEFNKSVVELANDDKTGALNQFVASFQGEDGAIANNEIFSESINKLANGENGEIEIYMQALKDLTTATQAQIEAAQEQTRSKIKDKVQQEFNKIEPDVAKAVAAHVTQGVRWGEEGWQGRQDALIRDLRAMGISQADIDYRLKHGKGKNYLDAYEAQDLIEKYLAGAISADYTRMDVVNAYLDKVGKMRGGTGGLGEPIYQTSTRAASSGAIAIRANELQQANAYFASEEFKKLAREVKAGTASVNLPEEVRSRAVVNFRIAKKNDMTMDDIQKISGMWKSDFNNWQGKWFMPKFAVGTAYVPKDMVAEIHKGERIIPAKENLNLSENSEKQVELLVNAEELSLSQNRLITDTNEIETIQNKLITNSNDWLNKLYTQFNNFTYSFFQGLKSIHSDLSTFESVVAERFDSLIKGFMPFWDMVEDARNKTKSEPLTGPGGGLVDVSPLQQGDPYVKYGITSRFGPRKRPTAKASTNHKGTDYAIPYGTAIPAFDNGVVVANSQDSVSGNYVIMQNSNGYRFSFCHLKSKSPLSVGDAVKPGTTMGFVGSTGASTGPHLHLAVKNPKGEFIDPEKYFQSSPGLSEETYSASDLNKLLAKIGIVDLPGFDMIDSFKLSGSQKEFVSKMLPFAKFAAGLLGTTPGTLLAQWGLESAWGASNFARTRNNFAGINAIDSNPNKASKFSSVLDFAKSYVNFILGRNNNSSYVRAGIMNKSGSDYYDALKRGGYATDPNYVSKLTSIYNSIGVHQTGLSKVPYDNYIAVLHKNERVLNAKEAQLWDQVQDSQIAEYKPAINDVSVYVDTDRVVDAVEVLTGVVKEIYEVIKPKSTPPRTTKTIRKNNLITQYT